MGVGGSSGRFDDGGGEVVILLEEAIERYAFASSEYGITLQRHPKPRHAARQVAHLESQLDGLRFSAELRHLWSQWRPESFGSLFFDGLYRPEEVLSIHERNTALGFPNVCLPLAYIEKAGVWIELETPDHPGGRIYHTYHADAELRLWCVGLSDLVHLVAETIERDGVNEPESAKPWLDHAMFESVRRSGTSELLAMPDEWRVQIDERSTWPRHWQSVEASRPPSQLLQGRTHSVSDFDTSRERGRISGTLVGQITGLMAGGPIDGTVINFADESGSTQIYVPVEVERAVMGVGSGVRIEIDVMGEPSARGDLGGGDTRNFMLRRSFEELSASELRLLEQMRKLEIAVAATAVRVIC
jgi:hypothetical protein